MIGAVLIAIVLAALIAGVLLGRVVIADARRRRLASDPLAQLDDVRSFKCNNWAGHCQVPCGYCGDW